VKAWQLERLGGSLRLTDQPVPQARAGGVVVRVETSSLMSYMKEYIEGKLPIYHTPDRPFIPGGNGVGYVHATGPRCVASDTGTAHRPVLAFRRPGKCSGFR